MSHHHGIGSITKVFVAVVVLQLIDESKLALSTTVGEILNSDLYSGIENAEQATIKQLLSHHAGIDSWEEEPCWIVKGRGRDIRDDHIWGKTEALDYIRRSRVTAPEPGHAYYSNTNYTLLGLIIEKITNQTAEDEIRRRILEPLNMDHTYFEGFEKAMHPENLPHRYHGQRMYFVMLPECPRHFPGGMVSSAHDLLKFATALRDGRLLGSAGMETLKDWKEFHSSSQQVGHGIFLWSSLAGGKEAWLGHNGGVLGFSSFLLWKKSGDCAISVLANVGSVHSGAVPSNGVDIITRTNFLEICSYALVKV